MKLEKAAKRDSSLKLEIKLGILELQYHHVFDQKYEPCLPHGFKIIFQDDIFRGSPIGV